MHNIKLTLQYDGTAYHGWQTQENAVTVQATVENAIKKLTGVRPQLVGCGRTDAGVHAKKYICNFKSETEIPCDKLPYALNSQLPDDIVCTHAEYAEPDFDSRKSAKGKTYTYLIANSKYRNVFYTTRAWHYRYKLDINEMRKAAESFLGTHDFIGFAASGFTVKTTVRTVTDIKIESDDDIISISVTGNGFLYNMVRIITGTLVYAGNGKLTVDEVSELMKKGDRRLAGITAPPQGLALTEVFYE